MDILVVEAVDNKKIVALAEDLPQVVVHKEVDLVVDYSSEAVLEVVAHKVVVLVEDYS